MTRSGWPHQIVAELINAAGEIAGANSLNGKDETRRTEATASQ